MMVRFIFIYLSRMYAPSPCIFFNPCHINFIIETYIVSVEIDKVPVGHHDVPCQAPNEQTYIEGLQELIKSLRTDEEQQSARDDGDTGANAEFDVDVTVAASSTATETASEEEVIGNCVVDNDTVDTDDDIWSGKRSKERKKIDSVASARLLEIIKNRWEVVSDKKVSRQLIFSSIAAELRQSGVNISRKPDIAWLKVYARWNKLKDSYKTYTDSMSQTGKGSSKSPPFYQELHELLGNSKCCVILGFVM